MIGSFRHKGLRRLYEDDDGKLIRADQIVRIATLLGYLEAAQKIDDLAIPSLRLHPLKGKLDGY